MNLKSGLHAFFSHLSITFFAKGLHNGVTGISNNPATRTTQSRILARNIWGFSLDEFKQTSASQDNTTTILTMACLVEIQSN